MSKKAPVYFLSHGGPSLMFDDERPAYRNLAKIGKHIQSMDKPTAMVVLSAHWEGGRDSVEVNVEENATLIYDFYGFPGHYYKQKYPNKGSKQLAEQVISLLRNNGIKASETDRGLDHGIWVPFKVAFDPEENPLRIPIVQVSLFDNGSVEDHLKLGHALSPLRDQNIMIVGGGMTVHNLRASMPVLGAGIQDHVYPFTPEFNDAAVKAATTSTGGKREDDLRDLFRRQDLRLAHPSLEHLMPLAVCCGAAGDDIGECLFKTVEFGALGWASFCFGGEKHGNSNEDASEALLYFCEILAH